MNLPRKLTNILISSILLVVFVGCTSLEQQKKIEQTAMAHYKLGVSYLMRGNGPTDEKNRRQAFPDLQKAVELSPESPLFHTALGTIHLYEGNLGLAAKEFRKSLELAPDDADARNSLGSVYLQEEKWSKAIQEYKIALNNPTYPTPEITHYNLGYAYFQWGKYEEAIGAFNKAVRLRPDEEIIHYYLGASYSKLGKMNKAVSEFKKAIEIVPESVRTHYELGVVYLKKKENEKAAEGFRKVIELDPLSDLAESAERYLEILE